MIHNLRSSLQRKVYRDSLLKRVLVLILCLLAGILLMFYVYQLYDQAEQNRIHMMESTQELVDNASGNLNRQLDDLSLLLYNTLMSPDVIPLALSPQLRDFENMRTITGALANAAQSSALIDALYLSNVKMKVGLSSDYTASNYQDVSYEGVLSRFQTRKHKLSACDHHGTTTYFYAENDDIYLIQGFSNIKYQGCSNYILMHLNSDAFYDLANASRDEDLLIFDALGRQLYSGKTEGGRELPEEVQELVKTLLAEEESSGVREISSGEDQGRSLLFSRIQTSGWLICYETEDTVRIFGSRQAMVMMQLIILLTFAFLIRWALARVNEPIRKLVDKVQASSDLPTERQSEWDYLEYIYSNLVERKQELETYLPFIREIALQIDSIEGNDSAGTRASMEELIHKMEAEVRSHEDLHMLCEHTVNLFSKRLKVLGIDVSGYNQEIQQGGTESIVERTKRICGEMLDKLDGYYNSSQYGYIARVKTYIQENYADPNLSLEMTAEVIGINPTYLSRLFKNAEDSNFTAYVNEYRVKKCCQLLRDTELPAQEIGGKVGFASNNTFFRAFKKYTGVTPGQYRQEIRGEKPGASEEDPRTGGDSI